MLLYPPGTRGSYGKDVNALKKNYRSLITLQHKNELNLGVAWGCTWEYVRSNKHDYFITQIDEEKRKKNTFDESDDDEEEDSLDKFTYSRYRDDVWFRHTFTYNGKDLNRFSDEYPDLEEDWIEYYSPPPTKSDFYIVKLGQRYQWHFKKYETLIKNK